jgi:ribosomal protein L37AE/L43A
MTRIANSTCHKCHMILPRTEMHKTMITKNTGFSTGTGGKTRVYFRNREVWVCNECKSKFVFPFNISTVVIAVLIAIIIYLL